jgi:hypothetical protein
MTMIPRIPEVSRLSHLVHGFHDSFGRKAIDTTNDYTLVTAADGTATVSDGCPARVAIKSAVASAAGDEDCYLAREPEQFLFAANKPLDFCAIVQATEDDTNQNNLIVGLTDGVAANLLVSAGAGPKTSGTTLAFYKVDGGLNWWVHASLGSTQTKVELSETNSLTKKAYVGSGSAPQRLEIKFRPYSSARANVEFWIDDELVYIIQDWVFTSATEAQAVCGCKDGDAGDEVTINLYEWYCWQSR